MVYVDINQAINANGLRLILVQGMPSAWGVAVKAMMGVQVIGLYARAAKTNAGKPGAAGVVGYEQRPVVAWNDEKPINRWDDILLLLERLAPDKPLVPENAAERIQLFGIGHEICGELGFGWNRRLDLMRPADASTGPSAFGLKYGYRDTDAKLANPRVIAFMAELAATLTSAKSPRERLYYRTSRHGRRFLLAAFSNFVSSNRPKIFCLTCPFGPCSRTRLPRSPPRSIPYC